MSCFITRLLLPLRHTVWGSAIDYTFCTLSLLLSVLSGRGEQKHELSQRAAADGIASRPPRHTDNSLCVPSLRKLQEYVDFCAITYAIVQWCAATRLKRLSFCQMRQSAADLSFLIKRNTANAAMAAMITQHMGCDANITWKKKSQQSQNKYWWNAAKSLLTDPDIFLKKKWLWVCFIHPYNKC